VIENSRLTHFLGIGNATRKRRESGAEKCGFIGKLRNFDRIGRKRKATGFWINGLVDCWVEKPAGLVYLMI
jgi:hypothetical protein